MLVAVALIFMPLLDSSGSINWGLPSTTLGMVAYIFIRCVVGIITFLIFISFDEQGKVNILEDERYKNAYQKLYSIRDKDYRPMSPSTYRWKTRGMKGVTLSLSMIVGAFLVIECTLSYNYSILIAYGLTIIMSLITGLFQMMKSSTYWTEEFPLWVDFHIEQVRDKQEAEKALKQPKTALKTANLNESLEEITDGN